MYLHSQTEQVTKIAISLSRPDLGHITYCTSCVVLPYHVKPGRRHSSSHSTVSAPLLFRRWVGSSSLSGRIDELKSKATKALSPIASNDLRDRRSCRAAEKRLRRAACHLSAAQAWSSTSGVSLSRSGVVACIRTVWSARHSQRTCAYAQEGRQIYIACASWSPR